ncbi:MAG: DUF4345 family protein [Pseudomonadota bacterium]
MIPILNTAACLLTIGFGLIGWLAPRYTLETLNLATTGGVKMGLSEIRAASGALFVGLGVGALVLGAPLAFVMVGCAYAGAALGRITAIVLDGAQSPMAYGFFAAEVALALWLIGANLGAARL